MRARYFSTSVIAAIALGSVQPASAAVTLLGSSGQIAASYINDFETTGSSGPVTFSTGSRILSSSANAGGTSSGIWGFGVFPPTDVEALLSNSYTAVGMYFGNDDLCCTTSTNAILSVYSGVTFLGSVAVAANMNDTADQFIGLSSTSAFDRVVFSYSTNNLFRYIDDFRLGSPAGAESAVPEPATWMMMILGFGIVGGALRKRRQHPAKVRFAF